MGKNLFFTPKELFLGPDPTQHIPLSGVLGIKVNALVPLKLFNLVLRNSFVGLRLYHQPEQLLLRLSRKSQCWPVRRQRLQVQHGCLPSKV